jgi:hypothetical protein
MTRVPGGAKVQRRCGQCGEDATFYEKEVTATFRLYFIDVFDYRRHRVMACGCCGACYATDELGLPEKRDGAEEPTRSLGEGIDRAAQQVGSALGRAADAVESGISGLLSGGAATSRLPASRAARRDEEEDPHGLSPDDLDALEAQDPLEAKFRELERKAGIRSR